jgi:hypothetical protein
MTFEPKDIDAYIEGQKKRTLLQRCGKAFIGLRNGIDKHGAVATTLATVMIAILTAVYVYYSRKQWREMQSAGEQTTKLLCLTQQQVAIAKAANDDTHNLLVATQAAIFILDVDYNQNAANDVSAGTGIPFLEVRAVNAGKSAARKFFGEVSYLHRNATGKVLQSKQRPFPDDTVIGSGSTFINFPLVPAHATAMDYASDTLTVKVTVKYDDGFNDQKTQMFCKEMAVTPKRGPVWPDCGEGNTWKQLTK